jgi:rsbT co-antagonist protein RsbR
MTPFRVLTALLGLLVGVTLLSIGLSVAQLQWALAGIYLVVLAIFCALLWAHLRGWRWSAHITVALSVLVLIASVPPDPARYDVYIFEALIPAILSMILLPWTWVAGSFIVCFLGILVQISGRGWEGRPEYFVVLFVMAAGCVFSAIVGRTAQQRAEENARHAEEAAAQLRLQKDELAQQTEVLQGQNEQQRRLLDLVTTLEVPTVALAEGVLLAPLVGSLDSRRTHELTSRLLRSVSELHARLVVLDIAGVSVIDTQVAKALVDAARAVRLLGCQVCISGISAPVAITLTQLGIQFEGIKTARSPQEALAAYYGWSGGSVQDLPNGFPRHGVN